jgi:EAL domain-containing protein (putative c-di-GMP-specific phosphodiesterase class I)
MARQLLSAAFEFAAIVTSLLGPELEDRARSRADSSRVEEIVRERAFRTVFQPVIDLRSGKTVGHEALTRFEDGVAPDIWLAEAATVGRRTELDVAMLEAAVGAAARLPENTWLGTNVSPAAIEDQERLERALNRASRPVVLEVTEYERVDDYGVLSEAVRRLRPAVRLAVDDAGAGYASLRHVLMLRPDFVKLDQEWIRGVEGDAARQALIGALVLFSERTASVLIAEGVETEAELDTLRALGVELGQGFFLGRPS